MSAKLGDRAKDKVTGFIGTVTGFAEYIDREPQAYLEGMDSIGRPIGDWTPTSRLEPVEA